VLALMLLHIDFSIMSLSARHPAYRHREEERNHEAIVPLASSPFTRARERAMGATAWTALLLPLAALAGCARLMGYHPQEWYDARTACRQEMNERVPRSEPADVRGAYVEQCMSSSA